MAEGVQAKYQPYPAYKPSGEEWLGDIPERWEAIQIRHLTSVKRGASPRPIDAPRYFDENGEYAWTRIADVTASDMYLLKAPQRLSKLGSSLSVPLEVGELFLSIAGSVGKPCITGIKACIHDGFVYFPELKIPNKFLFYIFAGEQAYKGLGKFGTQLNLNTETVGGIKIGLPQSEGIQRIVDFLDHETAKIDALIAKQQRLIALLEEKRQAVISHAVTKGLDPTASLRPSGIDWLGDVPAHWEVRAIKHSVSMPITDGPHETPNFVDEGIPFVSAEAVSSGRIDFAKIRAHITVQDHARFSQKYIPKLGDIFMVKSGATTGKLAMVEDDLVFNIWSPLAAIRCRMGINPRFILHFMRSAQFQEAIRLYWSFGTQQNIGMKVIENLHTTIPPLEEQDTISHVLDNHVSKFDGLFEKAQSAIALLKERRTALISAAVTGKIDLRDWQLPEGASDISTQNTDQNEEALA
jgi:type I restriction enzyme S subunit